MASPSFSVVSSYQLMENHIAAAVLDGNNGFAAFQTPAGATILLSDGSDGIFRASVATTGSATGWTVTDLSPQLASRYPAGATLTARSFAASANATASGFVILLAVSVTQPQGGVDEVWMLSGPPGVDAAVWLVGGSEITWSKLAYDAAPNFPVAAITAANLQVTGLFLENGLEATDPTLAIVTVADPAAAGELRCFLLNLAAGAQPVWTYFPQEQNIGTAGLSMVPGRTTSGPSWGLYKLYALNGTPSLTFMPTAGFFGPANPVLLTVPDGATAIATLVYQPFGTTAFTDLFVAADGFIGYFPYDQGKPHQAMQLITHPLITGVRELHVVNCGGTVILWGLNGAGQVFYATAPLADRASPDAWRPPVALLAGTAAIAAVAGGAADAVALFAVAPLAFTTATGNGGTGLVRLARNPSTSAWATEVQPLPSTTDSITLKTYTTRILVVDENHLPQPGTAITATVSADCSLIINGSATTVATRDRLTLTTDSQGYVSFIHPVSSLATPSITVTLPDGSTAAIDPTGAVAQRLSGITRGDQLLRAQYVDAAGRTRDLVARGTDPRAVNGVVNGLQTISGQLPSLPTTAAFLAVPRAAAVALPRRLESSILTDLGELIQFVVHVVEDVAEAAFQVVEGVVHFVVTVAEEVFTAIVNTIEDAFHAITALFKWIGTELDALFRWLGFLFDWQDFVAVKNLFKSALTTSFASLGEMIAELQQAGDQWFAYTRSQLLGRLQSLPMASVGGGTLNGSWAAAQPVPAPVGPGRSDMRTDPRLGWLRDRASTPPNTAPAAVALSAEMGTATDALTTLLHDFAKAMEKVMGDAGGLIDGTVSPADFFSHVLTEIALLGVDAAQAVFDALCEALEVLLEQLDHLLNLPIEIPILSSLYELATGSPLTLFDLACLLLAIGTTLCYKIATGVSPTASLRGALSEGAVKQVFNGSLQSLLTPPGSAGAPIPGLSPALRENAQDVPANDVGDPVFPAGAVTGAAANLNLAVLDDSPDMLMQITGGLLIGQAITMAVDGLASASGNNTLSNIGFFADVTGRTLRGLIEIIDDGEPMQVGGSLVKWEFGWNCLCTLGTIGNISKEGWSSPTAAVTAENDYVVSLAWGIWQLVNIGKIVSETGECPVGRSGEAAIELLEPIQFLLLKAKQPVLGGAVVLVRSASAIVAGVDRFRMA
jgi:hypothetical protein